MSQRILIAGCGYVGIALGRLLAARGHAVWGLRRDCTGLPPEIGRIAGRLAAGTVLPHLPEALDAVVYAAGADAFAEAAYRAAYVEGPQRLLDALEAQRQSPRRIVFVSSTGVYAQQDGAWLDEDSPADPSRFSGRLLLEGERTIAAGPYPCVVMRLGGIYGPGRSRLAESVRQGAAVRSAGPAAWLNLIHRDDCAGALAHVLELANPAPRYLGVDGEPWERNALLSWIAQRLGVPEPPIVAAGDAPDPQRGGNRRFRNARLRASGYKFRYPSFRDGFESLGFQAVDKEISA